MDFRVGGSFTQKMQIAGKGEFTFTGKYDEIVVPERIVYHADFGFAVMRVMVEFFEQNGQTKVVLGALGYRSREVFVWETSLRHESFDKLDSILAGEAHVSR